jgi:5-(carboxyamino)imidazole ribonucleotide synthase
MGIIGAGQLARMMIQAAVPLNIDVRILAKTPNDSAALIAPSVEIGDPSDAQAIVSFGEKCDFITLDHELVSLAGLESLLASKVSVQPTPKTLRFAQDKLYQRKSFQAAGFPVPNFKKVQILDDFVEFGDLYGWPMAVKAITGGYDGRGVWIIDNLEAAEKLLTETQEADISLYAEEHVKIEKELAVLIARRPSGQLLTYPVIETRQEDGICHEVIAPAQISNSVAQRAKKIGVDIAKFTEAGGIVAIELFLKSDGVILINEIATRPHNSGHFTIDGTITSQFENHLRGVMDWPLGSTTMTSKFALMINILGTSEVDPSDRLPLNHTTDTSIHLYGKIARAGRKLGHITSVGENVETLYRSAQELMRHLQ